ncbi:hypothetical protein L484_006968 [Morus notabilis]|uniref:Uncharacterized protein n=1 Tax=Morus notabilis TaxID=981085 RepID=W9RRB2_9ROSA|nr:hypothetical protein L484_006968 [Morus notabilis]
MEQRLSQVEVQQYESTQQMREFWKYTKQRDLTLQKHFRANSRRFYSFPKFPHYLCSSSSEDEEPGPTEETAPLSLTPPPAEQ